MTEMLAVVEVPVHPADSVHVYVYGEVPPDAVAVNVSYWPWSSIVFDTVNVGVASALLT